MTSADEIIVGRNARMCARTRTVRIPHSIVNRSAARGSIVNRRSGRVNATVLLVIIALAAGAAGGYQFSKRFAPTQSTAGTAGASDSTETNAGDAQQWYTCGMHPNVLQKTPGDCPICHMKLTPLKKNADAGDDGAAGGPQQRKILYWRAPMDPGHVSQKPGKSPMGMDLVPVYADEDESPSAHTIRIDPVTIQNMGIRTSVIKRARLVKTIRTVGRVDYDEQHVIFMDTKFNGWIERLFVDETGQRVERGQVLFDVYSPELYAAQQEYLSAVQNLPRLEKSTIPFARADAIKMVQAAVTKLKYMDVSDEQIETLRRTETVEKTLSIHSPASGIVTEKMALEGMYVKPGMRLYTIADLSRVWVYVDIYEYQLPWIHVGQQAFMTLPYTPGREFTGRVVYVYPYLEERTRVIKVRLEFDNPKLELKPGMYANIRLESELKRDAVLVPREAYIDSGTRQLAFVVLGNGKFAPRDLQVGVEAEDGMVEVLYGLDEGEVVVTSGQFMLDAESKLKEAVAKMMEAERVKTVKRSPASNLSPEYAEGLDRSTQATGGIPGNARYACPMDKHPDESDPANQGAYFSEESGRCPWCGMGVKPLDDLDWVRVRRAAQGGDVAYTCPDHQHVFADSSGQCPRCGRYLSPFKAMYTCPDPQHAGVITTTSTNCPHCGRGLAVFRSVWLDEAMAEENVPPNPGLAEVADYRCPVHPLVHSDGPGHCTICSAVLATTQATGPQGEHKQIPAGAKYTCPMKECWHFAHDADGCPVCGMRLKPINDVQWAKDMMSAQPPRTAEEQYICPMHPDHASAGGPGTCSLCGMQLVAESAMKRPTVAPEHVAAQMDYIMEHYLALQKLLAADRTTDVARQALGLASASERLMKHIGDAEVDLPAEAVAAARALHAAALKTTGASLAADRVTFVELSAAVRTLVEHARPDRKRWPKLYIYHCPMSKGDWVQETEAKNNPYYGFKMLNCGQLQGIK